MLTTIANAKINLGLEVVGRRDDGYHDVVTILQEIDLGDRVSFWTSPDITFESEGLSIAPESNLLLRAAYILQRTGVTDQGAAIRLEKSIPVGGGLGGGSSDAAATLRGLNLLWDLNLSDESLAGLARNLGSDVPFFIRGGTQLARGRGDDLYPLPNVNAWVVVADVNESIPNKTHTLYESLRRDDFSDGKRVQAAAMGLLHHGHIVTGNLVNAFERPALELFDGVRRAFEAVRRAGAKPLLAGAGPTVLSVHVDEPSARLIAGELQREGFSVVVAPTVPARPADLRVHAEVRGSRQSRCTEGQ